MDTNDLNQAMPPVPPPPQSPVEYAGFWIRVAAAIIDFFVLFGISFIISIIGRVIVNATGEDQTIINVLAQVAGLAYYTVMESSKYQGTIGKIAIGIKVTDLNGNRISNLRALGRYFAHFLSAIILLIGYIMVAFTEKKQGLHDKIAGTLVVKTK